MIDTSNGIPLYEQIVRQVKYAVAEGVALPSQVLPSVRELAKQLALNPNTVQRAYTQLQQEGVLESLRGRGMVVASQAKQQCVQDRQALLAARLEAVLREAAGSGFDRSELETMVGKALDSILAEKGADHDSGN